MAQKQYRTLDSREQAILDVLLAGPFPGRDEIRRQLETSLVSVIDEEGSLEFEVPGGVVANVERRIPVEAETHDEDGVPVRVLLHVVDGLVRELEFYKADGSKLRRRVLASQLRRIEPGEDIWLDTLPPSSSVE